ncbi:MAG: DUF1570 domain-containing protein [Planctomycetes bacterium]|nr:DUF1570 domain-containing protein [Planctomycetota bacterium]
MTNDRRLRVRLLFASVILRAASVDAGQLPTYRSRFYIIHSDLDRDIIREADLRLTRMAQVYMDRTKRFSGKITTRLPFYLFRHRDDYMAAGGLPGSAGTYNGKKLMAFAGPKVTSQTWKTVQHEGFHQFVRAVMGGDIPTWVNEGLAEYFGEAVFTGDDMITGLIPPARLQRVKAMIDAGTHKPVAEMMTLQRETWNLRLTTANYDQAWSMVHFLAHGDGGKYQSRFDGFINDLAKRGLEWRSAWLGNFDADTDAFEKAWRSYWINLSQNPSAHEYARATTATLTSFLARAHCRKQKFKNFDAFRQAAEKNELKAPKGDWLPPALVKNALSSARYFGSWSLTSKGRAPPTITCTLEDGTKLVGSITIKKRRVKSVKVRLIPAVGKTP